MVIPVYNQYPFKRQQGADFDKLVASWLMNVSAYAHNQFYGWTDYPKEVQNGKSLSWYTPGSKIGPFAGYIGTVKADDLDVDPIVISIRGTLETKEWLSDINILQKTINIPELQIAPKVHEGFWHVYTKRNPRSLASLQEEIRQEVGYLLEEAPQRQIYITAHSLGCAIASFISMDLALLYPKNDIINYSFAPPRVGDHLYVNAFKYLMQGKERQFIYWNIVNTSDIVPTLPPAISRDLYFSHMEPQKVFTFSRSSYLENHQLIAYHSGVWENLSLNLALIGMERDKVLNTPHRSYHMTSLKGALKQQIETATTSDAAVFVIPAAAKTIARATLEKLFLVRAALVPEVIICLTMVQGLERNVIDNKIKEIRLWLKKVELSFEKVPIVEVLDENIESSAMLKILDLHVVNKVSGGQKKHWKRKGFKGKLLAQARPLKGSFEVYFPLAEGMGKSLTSIQLKKREVIRKGEYFLLADREKIIGLGSVRSLGWF